jgi:hypothetical protein
MPDSLQVDLPQPQYPIGAHVLALINHQLRYAAIEQAFISVQLAIDDSGYFYTQTPRWEYSVSVFNQPTDTWESMVIAEHTILRELQHD